jgi:site-specific DNA-adenine methylase
VIFSYYGSKSKIWKKYPAPLHNIIIEPFSGAANYSLRYSHGRHVILIEKNPVIVSMLKWLQNFFILFGSTPSRLISIFNDLAHLSGRFDVTK